MTAVLIASAILQIVSIGIFCIQKKINANKAFVIASSIFTLMPASFISAVLIGNPMPMILCLALTILFHWFGFVIDKNDSNLAKWLIKNLPRA